jgi:hypothetical protein
LQGVVPYFSKGTNYGTRVLFAPNWPNEVLEARLSTLPGVILYEYKPKSTTPLPVVLPQSITEQLKNLVRKLKDGVADMDRIITKYLEKNPELTTYIKGGAITAPVAIIVGTIIEDIATLGGGIADDWASFMLAYRIVRVAWKL